MSSIPWQLALGEWLQSRPVAQTPAPSTGQVLVWNGTEWVPGAGSGGVTPPPTSGGAVDTGGGGAVDTGGGGAVDTGGGAASASASGAALDTGGAGSLDTGGGGALDTGGGAVALRRLIAELEARIAVLEGTR